MGIWEVKLKTHDMQQITYNLPDLNPCQQHGTTPSIFKMVVGKRKEVMYMATCENNNCGKIAWTIEDVVAAWNKWNPKPEIK